MCFSGNFVKSNIEVSLQRTPNMNAALCISYFSSPSRPYLVQRLEPGGGGAITLLLYFLLARELRLILSLELLHLRLGWPAGMPGSLAGPRRETGVFFFFIPGSGDFHQSQSETARGELWCQSLRCSSNVSLSSC